MSDLPSSGTGAVSRVNRDRCSKDTQVLEALTVEAGSQGVVTSRRAAPHPLGPIVTWSESVHTRRTRFLAVLVLLFAASLLLVAKGLHPDPSGMGTHRQLGFAPCSLPMLTGYPCPTCGMTTAFAYAAQGRIGSSFLAQPAGCLLAILTMSAALMAGLTTVSGRMGHINWYRVRPNMVAFLAVGVILGAWAFKLAMVWSVKGSP